MLADRSGSRSQGFDLHQGPEGGNKKQTCVDQGPWAHKLPKLRQTCPCVATRSGKSQSEPNYKRLLGSGESEIWWLYSRRRSLRPPPPRWCSYVPLALEEGGQAVWKSQSPKSSGWQQHLQLCSSAPVGRKCLAQLHPPTFYALLLPCPRSPKVPMVKWSNPKGSWQ